jgi:hypothetical protein
MKSFIVRSLSLAMMVTASTTLYAQDPTFTWGQEAKIENADLRIDEYIGHDDGAIYAIRESGSVSNRQVRLLKFNTNTYNLEFDKDINTSSGVMGNSYTQNDVLFSRSLGKTIVTGWHWSKEDQKVTAGLHVVGATGVWNDADRVDLIDYKAEKLLKSGNVEFNISEDGSKLIVLCEKPTNKELNERIRLAVYNTATWEVLWDKDIEYSLPDATFKRNAPFVDNAGNGYIVKKNKVKMNNFAIQVYCMNAATQEWKNFDINLWENQLGDYRVMQKGGNNLMLVGLTYPDGKSTSSPNGFVRIDMTASDAKATRTPFDKDLCLKFMSEKRFAKGKLNIEGLRFRDIIANENGETWFFMEKWTESKTAIEGSMGQYTYTRNYKDMVVIKLDGEGKYQWSSVVKRQQNRTYKDVTQDYGHYQYGVVNGKAYVIWSLLNQETSLYAWKTNAGAKMKTREVFGSNAQYSIFYYELDENGVNPFEGKKFNSMPMGRFYKDPGFHNPMVTIPGLCYPLEDRIIVYTELYPSRLRYRIGAISFQ